MRHMQLRDNGGITLTEVMLGIALIAIIVGVLSTFLVGMMRTINLSNARQATQQDARTCMDLMTRNLRQAQAYSVIISSFSTNPPQAPFSLIQFTHANGSEFQFYQLNNKLLMRTGTRNGANVAWRTAQTLSNNLFSLSFGYPRSDDDHVILVSCAFSRSTYQGQRKTLQMVSDRVRIMNYIQE